MRLRERANIGIDAYPRKLHRQPLPHLHRRPIVECQGRRVSTARLPTAVKALQSPVAKPDASRWIVLVKPPFPSPSEPNDHLVHPPSLGLAAIHATEDSGQPLNPFALPACGGNICAGGGEFHPRDQRLCCKAETPFLGFRTAWRLANCFSQSPHVGLSG